MAAYREEEKRRDEFNWMLGKYIESAVLVAVEKNLAGHKAKAEYIKKPFLVDAMEKNYSLTEEDIVLQRQQFVQNRKRHKEKFDQYHKNKN